MNEDVAVCPCCGREIHWSKTAEGWVHWTGSVWCGRDEHGLLTGDCAMGPRLS